MGYQKLGTTWKHKEDLLRQLEIEFVALRELLFEKRIISEKDWLDKIKDVNERTRELES